MSAPIAVVPNLAGTLESRGSFLKSQCLGPNLRASGHWDYFKSLDGSNVQPRGEPLLHSVGFVASGRKKKMFCPDCNYQNQNGSAEHELKPEK